MGLNMKTRISLLNHNLARVALMFLNVISYISVLLTSLFSNYVYKKLS